MPGDRDSHRESLRAIGVDCKLRTGVGTVVLKYRVGRIGTHGFQAGDGHLDGEGRDACDGNLDAGVLAGPFVIRSGRTFWSAGWLATVTS
jgi:hypothetical protein